MHRLLFCGPLAALALPAGTASAQRAISCSAQDQAAQITVRQEAAGYQVTIGDQPAETSVIFETPDRRQAVLSVIRRHPQRPAEVTIVIADFQSLQVQQMHGGEVANYSHCQRLD